MATTKSRQRFNYPVDNSDEDDAPRALDEEGICEGSVLIS